MKKLIIFIAFLLIILGSSNQINSAIAPPIVAFGDLDGVIRNIDYYSNMDYGFVYTEDDMDELNSKYYINYYLFNGSRFHFKRNLNNNLIIKLQPRSDEDYMFVYITIEKIGEGNITNVEIRDNYINNIFVYSENNRLNMSFYTEKDNFQVEQEEVYEVLNDVLAIFGKTVEE
ncbi:MAG: hypothetical protein WC008_00090 [Bacilli bacterium]